MSVLHFDTLFPTAHAVKLNGMIRSVPDDFQVREINQIPFSGDGEHVWLLVRKVGENTDWVARLLAKLTGVPRRNVGYAGLKDRHAITKQWFSIQLPNPTALAQLSEKLPPSIDVVEEQRHRKKLQKGNLAGNHFRLCIRGISGLDVEVRKVYVDQRLEEIAAHGVPNYFGPQRFGHEMGNITALKAWFSEQAKTPRPHMKSLYLSSGRSWVFNHVLAERVRSQYWNQALSGDVFQLQGSHSWFQQAVDAAIDERLRCGDIHPTGPMWGSGVLATKDQTAQLEQQVAEQHSDLSSGLEQRRLQQERRALRVLVSKLKHQWLQDDALQLEFELPAGAFATSVLREICHCQDNSRIKHQAVAN